MPGLNGTGPVGQGPMTGWGRGVCLTDAAPVYGQGMSRYCRGGMRTGRVMRRGGAGQRNMGKFYCRQQFFYPDYTEVASDELEYLKKEREKLDKLINELQSNVSTEEK